MSAISGATIAVTHSPLRLNGSANAHLRRTMCVLHSKVMYHIQSLLALPRSNLLSRRWKRSCDSFNPPWLTSRKTNNPRTANRCRRTTLPLTLRIRNMRFMLTTDTLYRRVYRLSCGDNFVPCFGDAPFWDLPPPRTFPYDHFRDHDD